ncbi:MAG: MGMT family protein [candidate division SR1 bacterium]|nr:MGMT family protein [candidate division SR1 bacterium]
MKESTLKEKILGLVSKIPENKVTYFGYIAGIVGSDARTVGWVLSGLNEAEMGQVPWYRVVAKTGFISALKLGPKGLRQKQILQEESYTLVGDSVDMGKHLWEGDVENGDLLF